MRRLILLGSAMLLAASSVPAAAEAPGGRRITGDSPLVSCTADQVGSQDGSVFLGSEVEPYAIVDPTDPDRWYATWQQDRWDNGGARANGFAVTDDGGETWTTSVLPDITRCGGGEFYRASDPWLAAGSDGVLYQMSLLVDNALGPFRSAMSVQRSHDSGATWDDPILLVDDSSGALHDKNALTVDPFDPKYAYAVWDISENGSKAILSRTTNGGDTWKKAKIIYKPGTGNNVIGHQIVVTGTAQDPVLHDFFVQSDPQGIKIHQIRSFDRGKTWEPQTGRAPKVIKRQPIDVTTPGNVTPVRTGFQWLFDVAVDRNSGVIYIVFEDGRFSEGIRPGIALVASADQGDTWSRPIRVNATPLNLPHPKRSSAFIPSVAVAPNGVVAVTYYDFRSDTGGGTTLTDFFAVTCKPTNPFDCSKAGKWNREQRITKTSFNIEKAPFARGLFIGDYTGLEAVGNRGFLAVYTRPHANDSSSAFWVRFNRTQGDPV